MILGLLAFLFVLWYVLTRTPMTWQQSSSGTLYFVARGKFQEHVADRLDDLAAKTKDLLDQADDMYPNDPRLANVRARWSGTLTEVAEKGDIAYSLNKRDIHVCVRDPATGELEAGNTCMYVLLHELAHVATDDYGHTPEFWLNFRWFLELAEKLGFYHYEDFDLKEVTFCGHTLGNNVLRCRKRGDCQSLLQ